MSDIVTRLSGIHNSIADDVYPDGWSGKCHKCGKPFYYTKTQCAYYLGHGWPKCNHNYPTAGYVAGSPDLYDKAISFGNSKIKWECNGYSRTGNKVKFTRIIGVDATPGNWALKVINIYVDPDKKVNVSEWTQP